MVSGTRTRTVSLLPLYHLFGESRHANLRNDVTVARRRVRRAHAAHGSSRNPRRGPGDVSSAESGYAGEPRSAVMTFDGAAGRKTAPARGTLRVCRRRLSHGIASENVTVAGRFPRRRPCIISRVEDNSVPAWHAGPGSRDVYARRNVCTPVASNPGFCLTPLCY